MTDIKPLKHPDLSGQDSNHLIEVNPNSLFANSNHTTYIHPLLYGSSFKNLIEGAEQELKSFFNKTDRKSNMSSMNPMDYGLKETSPDTLKRVLSEHLEGHDKKVIDSVVNHFNKRKDNLGSGIKQSILKTDIKPSDAMNNPLTNPWSTSHTTDVTGMLYNDPVNPLYQAEKGLISFFDKTDRTSNMSFMSPMDYGLKETSPDTLKRVLSKNLEGQDQEIIDSIVNHFNERKNNPRSGIKQSILNNSLVTAAAVTGASIVAAVDNVKDFAGNAMDASGIKSLFSDQVAFASDAYASPEDVASNIMNTANEAASNIMDTANEAGVDNQTIKEVVAPQPSRPSMR